MTEEKMTKENGRLHLGKAMGIFELKALPAAMAALIVLNFAGGVFAVRCIVWIALLAWCMAAFGMMFGKDWAELGCIKHPNIVALIMGACLLSPFVLVYAFL